MKFPHRRPALFYKALPKPRQKSAFNSNNSNTASASTPIQALTASQHNTTHTKPTMKRQDPYTYPRFNDGPDGHHDPYELFLDLPNAQMRHQQSQYAQERSNYGSGGHRNPLEQQRFRDTRDVQKRNQQSQYEQQRSHHGSGGHRNPHKQQRHHDPDELFFDPPGVQKRHQQNQHEQERFRDIRDIQRDLERSPYARRVSLPSCDAEWPREPPPGGYNHEGKVSPISQKSNASKRTHRSRRDGAISPTFNGKGFMFSQWERW